MVSGRLWYGATETAGDALETIHEAVSGFSKDARRGVPASVVRYHGGYSRCFR